MELKHGSAFELKRTIPFSPPSFPSLLRLGTPIKWTGVTPSPCPQESGPQPECSAQSWERAAVEPTLRELGQGGGLEILARPAKQQARVSAGLLEWREVNRVVYSGPFGDPCYLCVLLTWGSEWIVSE